MVAAPAAAAAVATGMEEIAPPAPEKVTNVPAVLSATPVVPRGAANAAAGRKNGWATVMLTRQTARVTANKPWGGNILVEEELLKYFHNLTYHNLHS